MKNYKNGFEEVRQLDSTNGNLFDFSEVIDTTVRDYTIEIDENNITDEVRHFDFSRGKYYRKKNIYFILAGGFNDYSKNDDFYYHYIY